MKRLQTLMAVPLMAGLLFVTGCDNDDEPLPAGPTNTVGPANTATNTAVPPTVTNTPLPPATATNTAIPPTATVTNTPEDTAIPTETSTPGGATETNTPELPTSTPTETPDTPIEAICGDGVTEADAGEQCDDSNNYGGDGCAANCTLEEDFDLNLGASPAQSQSSATVQTISFPISLPLTGRVVITYGEAREQASVGVDGFTNFAPNEIPLATVIDKNQVDGEGFVDPISVPGVACACLRGIELRTCGGRLLLPGNVTANNATPCNDDPDVCNGNPDGACIPAFGPGVNAGGRVGCDNTLEDLDYLVVADSFTGDTNYEASGGPVALGAQNFSFTAIGTILGTCDFDESNPDKGPDGIPCTDDDPESVRGVASVNVQTTGTAQATVLNANGAAGSNIEDGRMCGAIPCATKATGAAKGCEDLASGDASGLCLGSAFAALAQPTLGDIVTPSLFCGL